MAYCLIVAVLFGASSPAQSNHADPVRELADEASILAKWPIATVAQRLELLTLLSAVGTSECVPLLVRTLDSCRRSELADAERGSESSGRLDAVGVLRNPLLHGCGATCVEVAARVSGEHRLAMFEALLDVLVDCPVGQWAPVTHMARGYPTVGRAVLDRLPADQRVLRTLAHRVIVDLWYRDPASCKAWIATLSPAAVADALERPRSGLRDRRSEPDPDSMQAIARWLVFEDSRPEARALGATLLPAFDRKARAWVDAAYLGEVYDRDADLRVKVACLRVIGVLGPSVRSGIDLERIIKTETRAPLLTAAIQARTLWTSRLSGAIAGFEYWPGRWCEDLRMERSVTEPWSERSLVRLRALLTERTEPELRDACSVALCSRYRALSQSPPDRRSLPDWSRASKLRVHEWGVFTDGGNRLMPPQRVIDELPEFVHQSTASAKQIANSRTYRPTVVLKPVLFFRSPRPVVLQVKVGFQGGRPWTFYPEATDYVLRIETDHGNGLPPAISPPWIEADPTPGDMGSDRIALAATAAGDLPRRYDLAPWLSSSGLASATGRDPLVKDVGLVWRGLRVGYGSALESESPVVSEGHWWNQLRAVGADTVAQRGESEEFLFYDGAVGLPASLLVGWVSEARRELALAPRESGRFLRGSRFLPQAAGTPSVRWQAFVLRVDADGAATGVMLEDLDEFDPARRVLVAELPLSGSGLIRQFHDALVASGLDEREASSLLETWRAEFFETPGLRVLSLLPRAIYDALLPLEIFPVPGELERVALVWKECHDLPVTGAAPMDSALGKKVSVEFETHSLSSRWRPFPAGDAQSWALKGDSVVDELRSDRVLDAVFSGDAQLVVALVQSDDATELRLWDRNRSSRRVLASYPRSELSPPGPPSKFRLQLSANGQRVLVGVDGSFSVIDLESWQHMELGPSRIARLSADGGQVLQFLKEWVSLVDLGQRTETVLSRTRSGIGSVRDGSIDLSGRVLFGRGRRGERHLLLADPQAGTLRTMEDPRVLVGAAGASQITLSRDGRIAAYLTGLRRQTDVVTVDIESGRRRYVTGRDDRPRQLALSGDGRFLAYSTRSAGKPEACIVVELATDERWRSDDVRLMGISDDGSVLLLQSSLEPGLRIDSRSSMERVAGAPR